MDEQLAVGERIANLRKNLGLTQEKLAEQADISIQFLVQIEHGKRTMKITPLLRSTDIEEININSWKDIKVIPSKGKPYRLKQHFTSPTHASDMIILTAVFRAITAKSTAFA